MYICKVYFTKVCITAGAGLGTPVTFEIVLFVLGIALCKGTSKNYFGPA